jgi:hypothetical protein
VARCAGLPAQRPDDEEYCREQGVARPYPVSEGVDVEEAGERQCEQDQHETGSDAADEPVDEDPGDEAQRPIQYYPPAICLQEHPYAGHEQ